MMSEMVCLQGIAERSRSDANSRKGCLLGHRNMPREFLAWSCAEFSTGRGRKIQERNEDNLRRSVGMDGGGNRFLGGSDPILSGMGAAQRPGAPGVATAQLVQHTSSLRRRQSCKQKAQRL